MTRKSFTMTITFMLALASAGCGPLPVNSALDRQIPIVKPEDQNKPSLQIDYDFDAWLAYHDKLPEHAIILAVSGGGARAATLAYAIIRALSQYEYANASGKAGLASPRTLADSVIAISGASGGALTAARFVLDGAAKLDREYRDKILMQSLQNLIITRSWLNPLHWGDRAKPARDFLDDKIFGGRRYSDLMWGERLENAPFLFLNATDILQGRTFTFSQKYFSDLCSDLGRLPVSAAVVAAFDLPFALSDTELKNFRDARSDCRSAEGVDLAPTQDTFAERNQPYQDLVASLEARYRYSMRHAFAPQAASASPPNSSDEAPFQRIKFQHLYDAGLSDNIAVRPLLRAFDHDAFRRLAERGVKSVTLIQVNAHARAMPPQPRYQEPGSPGWIDLFSNTVFDPIDTISAVSSTLAVERLDAVYARRSDGSAAPGGACRANGKPVDCFPGALFPVLIDFDQLTDADHDLRDAVGAISLTAGLGSTAFAEVVRAGRLLLARNPCFQAFTRGWDGSPPADDPQHVYADPRLRYVANDDDKNNYGTANTRDLPDMRPACQWISPDLLHVDSQRLIVPFLAKQPPQ